MARPTSGRERLRRLMRQDDRPFLSRPQPSTLTDVSWSSTVPESVSAIRRDWAELRSVGTPESGSSGYTRLDSMRCVPCPSACRAG